MDEHSVAREDLDDVNYQIREVYAQYGLTSYMSQVMERGLVNVLVVHHTAESTHPTQSTYDANLASLSRLTMGQLVGRFEASTLSNPQMNAELQAAAKERNFVAHRFFWDRAAYFSSFSGREAMLTELAETLSQFEHVDQLLGDLLRTLMEQAGFNRQWLEDRVAEALVDLRSTAPSD